MCFLQRMAGLSHRDRVRSSAIRRELRVELLLLRIKKSLLRWFVHLVRASWSPPFGGFPGTSYWEVVPLSGGIIYPFWPGNISRSPRECCWREGWPNLGLADDNGWMDGFYFFAQSSLFFWCVDPNQMSEARVYGAANDLASSTAKLSLKAVISTGHTNVKF